MKELYYDRKAEGIGFSRNAYEAYLRGEKPKMLWPEGESLEPTEAHHIEIEIGVKRFRRKLVMFFRPCSP